MKTTALITFPTNDDSFSVHASASPLPFQRRRILVAEDNDDIRKVIMAALARAGFELSAACDGEEAWETLSQEKFDLLVTDIEMPRLAGTDLIERIRRNGSNLSVIVISGISFINRLSDYEDLRIAAFLLKPFKMAELVAAVKRVLPAAPETKTGLTAVPVNCGSSQPIHPNSQQEIELCNPK